MSGPATRRVGLIGTGNIAEWHVKALWAVPRTTIAAVCDVNAARAEGFAKRHKIPAAFGSFSEMHRQAAPEVVHVLVPAELHYKVAAETLEAGVHTLVEKPMATTAEQCDELIGLAERAEVRLAVSHNFLHAPVYESLRKDVKDGWLGPLDRIRVTWNKELVLVTRGPFDLWMLRRPENILLEIGAHAVSRVLDLAGPPRILSVHVGRPYEMPTGVTFYRRWQVVAEHDRTAIDMVFSFEPGFTEHTVQVRGRLASATADFERNSYVRHAHSTYEFDLDRWASATEEAKEISRQARRNVVATALSKATRSPAGNPFAASLAASLKSFYADLDRPAGETDPRNTAVTGREVVAICEQIGRETNLPESAWVPEAAAGSTASGVHSAPEVLVLGATGFIGQAVVRELVKRGQAVRVLARRPTGLAATFDPAWVEVVAGDASRPEDLERALEGIQRVVHLARAQAKTYQEFLDNDVSITRRLAEACQRHGVKRLIYASSISPYYSGGHAGTITEETPLDPKIGRRNAYARAKATTEEMLLDMGRKSGLAVVIVRPGIVLGQGGTPFHPGVGLWSWDATCQYWGKGENPLPIVLVEDVATGIALALETPGIEGQSFNLVGEPCLTARQYIAELEAAGGFKVRAGTRPIWKFYAGDMSKWVVKMLVRHHDRRRPSYRDWESRSQRAVYDCSRAKQVLGWKPAADRETIVERGIREPLAEMLRVKTHHSPRSTVAEVRE